MICLFCSNTLPHYVNEDEYRITIDEKFQLICQNKLNVKLFSMVIHYCPICGRDLDYRYDIEVDSPTTLLVRNLCRLEDLIAECFKTKDYHQGLYYLSRRDGIKIALDELGIAYDKKTIKL